MKKEEELPKEESPKLKEEEEVKVKEEVFTRQKAEALLNECIQTHSWIPLVILMRKLIVDLPEEVEPLKEKT